MTELEIHCLATSIINLFRQGPSMDAKLVSGSLQSNGTLTYLQNIFPKDNYKGENINSKLTVEKSGRHHVNHQQ